MQRFVAGAFRLSASMVISLSTWPEAVTTCIRSTGDPSSVIRDSSPNRRKAVTAGTDRRRPRRFRGRVRRPLRPFQPFAAPPLLPGRMPPPMTMALGAVISTPKASPSEHHHEQVRFREA